MKASSTYVHRRRYHEDVGSRSVRVAFGLSKICVKVIILPSHRCVACCHEQLVSYFARACCGSLF